MVFQKIWQRMGINFNMIKAKVLVYDTGWFVSVAQALVGQFEKVYYFCPWESGYSDYIEELPGVGIKGVEKVYKFWDIKNKIDLFVFTDYVFGDLQEELKRQGKLVWGFGNTNWLEEDRWNLRQWQKDNGLPYPPTTEVIGIDALKEEIKEGQFIKISRHRKTMETAKKFKGKTSEQFFDDLAVNLSVGKNEISINIEDPIKGEEPGYDTYTINGENPKLILAGIEEKDEAYIGSWIPTTRLAKPMAKANDKLNELFKKEKISAFHSTEFKMPNSNKAYLLDFTARMGNPPFPLYCAMIINLGEIFYYGAQGIMIQPKLKAKWGAIAIINSDFAKNNGIRFDVDEKIKDWLFVMNLCIIDGQICSLPIYGLSEIGAVVGIGNTMDIAIAECKKHAEGISGYQLEIDTASLDKAKEKIIEARKYGVIL